VLTLYSKPEKLHERVQSRIKG